MRAPSIQSTRLLSALFQDNHTAVPPAYKHLSSLRHHPYLFTRLTMFASSRAAPQNALLPTHIGREQRIAAMPRLFSRWQQRLDTGDRKPVSLVGVIGRPVPQTNLNLDATNQLAYGTYSNSSGSGRSDGSTLGEQEWGTPSYYYSSQFGKNVNHPALSSTNALGLDVPYKGTWNNAKAHVASNDASFAPQIRTCTVPIISPKPQRLWGHVVVPKFMAAAERMETSDTESSLDETEDDDEEERSLSPPLDGDIIMYLRN
ncbi:hypothetical protein BV25DRAFT_1818926 [Artomyces pyxidatus]|uniref:Uncharacterized protein n=1 Tax=Artomyces pyxidatus TaxID=48021 RepID=A0ACB8TGJ0_9AGAM|nr:hypothetical protein BV25DRAFT_1818926 [Artomyces pyxidatus]